MRAIVTTCAVAGVAALGLAACGVHSPPHTAASGRRNRHVLKIALIAKSSTNPVFLSARTGAEQAAKMLTQKHNVPVKSRG